MDVGYKRSNDLILNFGLGLSPYPYTFLKIGVNKQFFEFGGDVLFGICREKGTYSGTGVISALFSADTVSAGAKNRYNNHGTFAVGIYSSL